MIRHTLVAMTVTLGVLCTLVFMTSCTVGTGVQRTRVSPVNVATSDGRRLQTVIDCELTHSPNVEAIRQCVEQAATQREASAAAAVLAQSPAVAYDSPQYLYGWTVSCLIDRMSDGRLCSASKGDLEIRLMRGAKLPFLKEDYLSVSIPPSDKERYPGSLIFVRLDTQPALFTDAGAWCCSEARDIVARMCLAERIATRYTNWPWNHAVEHEFSLDGFRDVWEYLQKAVHAR